MKVLVSAILVMCGGLLLRASLAGEPAVAVPPAAVDNPRTAGPLQTAVLAGGCFWGVQGVYQHMTACGFVGLFRRTKQYRHYEPVGTGQTGHAESVEITFDPQQVSYGEILQVFFSVAHDPTQVNRQGPDAGSVSPPAIFYGRYPEKSRHRVYRAT
jgi:peptide-methionine (S)-S-oxide reductase